ncbi:MAG: hypothetical protein HQK65_13340 [Desulfamplus sp.]|nr:hypothetical protein [Desulfamplus sp.]
MNNKPEYLFGSDHFEEWAECKTYPLFMIKCPGDIANIVDHGFIADRACIWGGAEFHGYEMAVISRTYCSDDVIDNPPSGLKCIRLPEDVMGKDDMGTAIATVIVGNTPAANDILNLALFHVPAIMLPYMLPVDMCESNLFGVTLTTEPFTQYVSASITYTSDTDRPRIETHCQRCGSEYLERKFINDDDHICCWRCYSGVYDHPHDIEKFGEDLKNPSEWTANKVNK